MSFEKPYFGPDDNSGSDNFDIGKSGMDSSSIDLENGVEDPHSNLDALRMSASMRNGMEKPSEISVDMARNAKRVFSPYGDIYHLSDSGTSSNYGVSLDSTGSSNDYSGSDTGEGGVEPQTVEEIKKKTRPSDH